LRAASAFGYSELVVQAHIASTINRAKGMSDSVMVQKKRKKGEVIESKVAAAPTPGGNT
jgi:hypothetical protein